MATSKFTTPIPHGHWQDEDDLAVRRASDESWAENLRQPHCIALGDSTGKIIPGTRLTEDMPLRECAEVMKTMKTQHPRAGIYLASVVNARAA